MWDTQILQFKSRQVIFKKTQQHCWEENQNPELLQYINLKMHNFKQKYCKTSKKLRKKKKQTEMWPIFSPYIQGEKVVNRHWLWTGLDVEYSKGFKKHFK